MGVLSQLTLRKEGDPATRCLHSGTSGHVCLSVYLPACFVLVCVAFQWMRIEMQRRVIEVRPTRHSNRRLQRDNSIMHIHTHCLCASSKHLNPGFKAALQMCGPEGFQLASNIINNAGDAHVHTYAASVACFFGVSMFRLRVQGSHSSYASVARLVSRLSSGLESLSSLKARYCRETQTVCQQLREKPTHQESSSIFQTSTIKTYAPSVLHQLAKATYSISDYKGSLWFLMFWSSQS